MMQGPGSSIRMKNEQDDEAGQEMKLLAEKDFREKRLEDFDDVFADIINGLLFHGEKRVLENDLESGMPRSAYKNEKTLKGE